MIRKILFGLLTALLALSLVGCGGDDSGDSSEKKTETAKPEFSADKAVLGYAQLYSYGVPEDDAAKATGLSAKEIEEAQVQVIAPLIEAFREFPISEENAQAITTQYIEKLQAAMDIKTKLKTDDPKNPVVELTASVLNIEGVSKVAEENTDLVALGAAMAELQAQGMTEEQLKENAEFQKFALESINKFIDEFPLNPEESVEIRCEAIEGSDGKLYWAPADIDRLKKFVTGE